MNPYILAPLVFALGLGLHPAPSNPIAASSEVGTICTKAGQYCINQEAGSNRCAVQETTDPQIFGPNLAGPFESRAEGTRVMCKQYYDPASEDTHKCGAVVPEGVCDNVK